MKNEENPVLLGVPCNNSEFQDGTCFLGGRPVWIGEAPDRHLLCCSRCKDAEQVVFLFQCPASYEEDVDRFLYLFACVKEECLQSPDGWILLRSVVRRNTFHKDEVKQQFWEDFCATEGSWNSEIDDRSVSVGGEFEQLVEHWKDLSVSISAKKEAMSSMKHRYIEGHSSSTWNENEISLPQVYLEVIEEPKMKQRHNSYSQNELMEAEMFKKAEEHRDEDFDIEGVSFFSEMNKDEWKYYKRIECCPNQCIRYQFSGTPLIPPCAKWNKCTMPKIPDCQRCGSRRVFELQIMSQFLYFLKKSSKERNMQISLLDEGSSFMSVSTILLFICSNDCKAPSEGTDTSNIDYSREYVIPIFENLV